MRNPESHHKRWYQFNLKEIAAGSVIIAALAGINRERIISCVEGLMHPKPHSPSSAPLQPRMQVPLPGNTFGQQPPAPLAPYQELQPQLLPNAQKQDDIN